MSVEPDAPFFSSADGKRCRGTSINRLFKAVLQRAGIFAGAKGTDFMTCAILFAWNLLLKCQNQEKTYTTHCHSL